MTEDPLITRRRLLAAGGAVAATAMLPEVAGAARRRPVARPSWLERRSFSQRVGQLFTLRDADGRMSLVRLTGVGDLNGRTSRGRSLAGRDDAFMLTFRHARGRRSAEGILELAHPRLGRNRFFVVPGTTTYTVVVNRSD